MNILIRQAGIADLNTVSEILIEAELWLEKRGIPLWNVNDLSVEYLREDVASGFYILAEANGKSAGTFKYVFIDPLCWPDLNDDESRLSIVLQYVVSTLAAQFQPQC